MSFIIYIPIGAGVQSKGAGMVDRSPEKIAATLAIRLLEVRQKQSTRAALFEFFNSRRNRVEEIAAQFLEKDCLPLAPYMPHIVYMAVGHFENCQITLPTEREVIDWITESGGIGALLLRKMAVGVGPSP